MDVEAIVKRRLAALRLEQGATGLATGLAPPPASDGGKPGRLEPPEPPEPPEPYAASLPTDQLEQQIRSATQLYHRLEHKAMRTRAALDVVKALEREADAAVDAVDRRKRMLLPASAAA